MCIFNIFIIETIKMNTLMLQIISENESLIPKKSLISQKSKV